MKVMRIISFLNPKGGSGKTTSVINIATCLVRKGFKVAVVDTDPQLSLTNWNKPNKALFDVYTADSEKDVYNIRKELTKFDYDFVLVDGAGSLSVITAAGVMVSDLVIIPLSPSPLDFSASGSVLDVIAAMSESKDVKAKFLVNRVMNNATMTKVLRKSIEKTPLGRFRTSIGHRQSYVRTLLSGETVFESTDGAAKGEIEVLVNEIVTSFD